MSSTAAPRKKTSMARDLGFSAATLRRVLALGAAAGVLASSAYAAVPAFGAGESSPAPASPNQATASPSPTLGSTAPASTTLSQAALDDAVQRDLKLTPQQFEAAGQLGAQAAQAAVQLRQVPGYVGIRIENGSIIVSGSGQKLQAAVAALAGTISGLSLAAPAAVTGSELAVSTEQLFQAYLREVGAQGLQAVMYAGGKFVIRTGGINAPEALSPSSSADPSSSAAPSPGAGKITPAQFVSRYANVELDGGTPLNPRRTSPAASGTRPISAMSVPRVSLPSIPPASPLS
ncbi:hypothetical protein ACX5I6_09070 [Arthrobacter sp. MMS24-T111]